MRTDLEQWNDIRVQIIDRLPFGDQRRHEDVDKFWRVEGRADSIGECTNRIVQNEEILLLIAVESADEDWQYSRQIWDKLGTSNLFERRKSAAACFLYPLVAIACCSQELHRMSNKVQASDGHDSLHIL